MRRKRWDEADTAWEKTDEQRPKQVDDSPYTIYQWAITNTSKAFSEMKNKSLSMVDDVIEQGECLDNWLLYHNMIN